MVIDKIALVCNFSLGTFLGTQNFPYRVKKSYQVGGCRMPENEKSLKEKMGKRPTFSNDNQLKALELVSDDEGMPHKPYKVNDAKSKAGLYVYVGARHKVFRLDYTFDGKVKTFTIGKYQTEIGLKEARDKAKEARAMLALGKDPSGEKQAVKQAEIAKQAEIEKAKLADMQTFSKTAQEFLEIWEKGKRSKTIARQNTFFNGHILPVLGNMPIAEIKQDDIVKLYNGLDNISATKNRILGLIKSVFQYAIAKEYVSTDPTLNIEKLLPKSDHETKHFDAIVDPIEVAKMLQKIDDFVKNDISMSDSIKFALQLICYLPLRNFELCGLKWSEIDFEHAQINLPKDRVKTKNDFTLPLSTQALELLKQAYDRRLSVYVFQSIKGAGHIGNASLLRALKNAGIEGQSVHGFRSTFSSICFSASQSCFFVKEYCLNHKVGNQIEQSYNRASLDSQKRRLLQWYSDCVDSLRAGNGMIKFDQSVLTLD